MLPNHSSSLEKRALAQDGGETKKKRKKSSSTEKEKEVQWGLFHHTTVGAALIKSLNTLVGENKMSEETARKILDNFDREVVENFQTQMSTQQQSDTVITADALNYNCSRSDWRIDATNITIEMGADTVHVENGRFLFRTIDK